jgi:DMSO reductase family type II enzyme chaperone
METDTLAATAQAADIDIALCRATLYSALALGFRPPEKETKARLTTQEAVAALAEAAALLDAGGDAGLGAAVKTLVAADASPLDDLVESYRRLFGHSARGAVPPYETEYGAEALFQQPQEMGDLMGFYNAFGLALNGRQHERADHVSCECEFLCFLALKEAYALEHGDDSMLEETRKAERLFLRDHLARFLPAFAKKLVREDAGGLYGFLGGVGYGFIVLECARFSVRLGPENLTLRPADDERVPMACGSGECPAMPGVSELDETE